VRVIASTGVSQEAVDIMGTKPPFIKGDLLQRTEMPSNYCLSFKHSAPSQDAITQLQYMIAKFDALYAAETKELNAKARTEN
jgi:hypothetical protein